MERLERKLDTFATKLNGSRSQVILVALILCFQVCLMIYWTTQKSNYYIDELFSFGSAHCFTFDKKDIGYIMDSDEWSYEEWIDNSVLKKQLEISSEESLLARPPFEGIKMLLSRRNHQGILNLLMSVFSPEKVSFYPGIIFNLFLFVFSQLLLYRICRELLNSPLMSFLAITMYGFSPMAISMVVYVRFYALVIFLVIAVVRIHQIMWRTESIAVYEVLILFSMFLIYLAMKNSELVFTFGAALILSYQTGTVIKQKWKKAICYFITVVPAGICYAYTKTSFLDMFFHPESYVNRDGPVGYLIRHLVNFNISYLKNAAITLLGWISTLLVGSWYVFCLFIFLVLVLLEIRWFGGPHEKKPYADRLGFIGVILSVSIIYTIFALLTSLPEPRYMSLVFPLFAILVWKLLETLTQQLKYKNVARMTCAALALAGILVSELKYPDRIDHIYREDRAVIQKILNTDIQDAVTIFSPPRHPYHPVYECINLMPDSGRIYPLKEDQHHIDTEGFPNDVLIWYLKDQDIEPYIGDLTENGYVIEKIGSTYTSDVYTAKRDS